MLLMVAFSRLDSGFKKLLKSNFLKQNPTLKNLEMQNLARKIGNKQYYSDELFRKNVLKLRENLILKKITPEKCVERYQKELVKSIERSEDAYIQEKWELIEEKRREAVSAAPKEHKGQVGAF